MNSELPQRAAEPDSPSINSGPSSSSNTVTAWSTEATAVVWKRQILPLLGVLVGMAILIAWIAAALFLWKINLFLPLNYFSSLPGTGHHLTSGNYNSLISSASSLAAALVCYSVSQGFIAVLRRKLTETSGMTLYSYEALVSFSRQVLQFKGRPSALLAALIFGTVQAFHPGSQASFGSSVALTNITIPSYLARISDNVEFISTSWSVITAGMPLSNDADRNVNATVTSLDPDNTGTFVATVYNTEEVTNFDLPLFSPLNMFFTIGEAAGSSSSVFTDKQRDLVASSGNTTAFANSEGFFADVTCAPVAPQYRSTVDSQLAITAFNIVFECGTKVCLYSTANQLIADMYACQEGTNDVYMFTASPASGALLEAYRCSVTARSAVVPVLYQAQLRNARVTGPARYMATLPNSLDVVGFMGRDLLNNYGLNGWVVLNASLANVRTSGYDTAQYATVVVETLTKMTLAKVSGIVNVVAGPNDTAGAAYSAFNSQYQVQALKIHPTSAQLVWLCAPLGLLLMLVATNVFLCFPNQGRVDFSNPVATAVIGIGSTPDPAVSGMCTGEVPEESTSLRLRYGKIHGTDRLMFTPSPENVRLERPRRGEKYY